MNKIRALLILSLLLFANCQSPSDRRPFAEASNQSQTIKTSLVVPSGPEARSVSAVPTAVVQAAQSVVTVVSGRWPAQVAVNDGRALAPAACDRPAGGSGFVYHARGFVLTSAHVVQGADEVTIILPDGRTKPARVVGIDPSRDWAVVYAPDLRLRPLASGKTADLVEGQQTYAIGAPPRYLPAALRLHGGQIEEMEVSLQSQLDPSGKCDYQHLIKSSSYVELGYSGGPLVDARGRILGIITAVGTFRRGAPRSYSIPLSGGISAGVDELIDEARSRQ